MNERLPLPDKGLYLAADVDPDAFPGLMHEMKHAEGLTGVKVGFELGLGMTLRGATETVLSANPNLDVIYDHQKGGNDIPETGMNFARAMRRGEVSTAILFPFTGPATQKAWTEDLMQSGIKVITGAEMTHKMIAAVIGKDGTVTEGYVHPSSFARMFEQAVELGVRDFVVPGNKPEAVQKYRETFDREIGIGEFVLWAPGFIDQGGDVSETGKVAGERFNAIVGGGIYKSPKPRDAASDLGRKMMALNAA